MVLPLLSSLLLISLALGLEWTVVYDASVLLRNHRYATIGYNDATDKIYFLGGHGGIDEIKNLEEYNVGLNVFTDHGNILPVGVYAGGQLYTQIGDIIYIISPYNPYNIATFDVNTRSFVIQWYRNGHTVSIPSSLRNNNAFNRICVTHYIDNVNTQYLFFIYMKIVEIYDITNDQWLSNIPQPQYDRRESSCITHNNYLYVIGGLDTNKIEKLYLNDMTGISSRNWLLTSSTLGNSGYIRLSRAVAYKHNIYVTSSLYMNGAYIIDTVHNDSISTTGGYNVSRSFAGAPSIVIGDILYQFGMEGEWVYAQLPNTTTTAAPTPLICDDLINITHINWDLIMNDINDDEIPYYNVTLNVNENDLSVEVDVDLEYLGYSYADNGIDGFGTTYFISLNSFSSNQLDIFSDNGLSECDNRNASSFVGKQFTEKWEYSNYPYLDNHVGSTTYLAYPPSGDHWSLSAFDTGSGHKCDRINYFGSFSWFDLQNKCINPQTNDSSVNILIDNDWINLTGTFYINIVSPLYKDIDSGIYRIYELINEQFIIAVSKSVHVLGSTGISLYKISIIAINTDEGEFKLDVLTESADYLQLTTPTLLIAPNGYEFNINSLNNGDCLSFKSNICIQTWQISTIHNETCNNFGGVYGIQWIAQCNLDIVNNTRCLSYNGDTVTLSVESDYEDKTCDIEIGKAQFDGIMSFYPNESFIGNNNDYLFIVGKDIIYVEIELNYPLNVYSIFDSKLINVWLCTIDDEIYGSTFSVQQTNPSNTGCLSSIIDNDGYNPYWIIQDHHQSFEHDAVHINNTNNSNIIRFSFVTPYTLKRDRLWVHAQIELYFINNRRRRRVRRVLLNTESSIGEIRHFMSSINIQTHIIDDTISNQINTTKQDQEQETDDAIAGPPTLIFYFIFSVYLFFFL